MIGRALGIAVDAHGSTTGLTTGLGGGAKKVEREPFSSFVSVATRCLLNALVKPSLLETIFVDQSLDRPC